MEEKFIISSREQADLITDPFTITIIGHLEVDVGMTSQDIATEIHESPSMVKEYLERLCRVGLLEKKEVEGKDEYFKVAHSYTLESLNKDFQGDIHNHWGFGLIHHLEGDFTDLLSLLDEKSKRGDFKSFLEDLGYADLFSSICRAYLTPEDYKRLGQLVLDFCKEHQQKESDEESLYEIFFTITPNLPRLRKKIKEREEKEEKR